MSTSKVEYILSLKDLFSQQIKNALKQTENLNNAVNNTNSSFSGLAKVAAGAFSIYQVTNFARSVVEVGSSFESAEMGLKTFLKTNEAAHSAFLNIQKDAATTPFDFQSLLQANNALISTGMKAESAREDVLALANAVAGSGKGSEELSRMAANLQQIKNLGKANAMDIKQFGIAGINIYGILADAMGKNVEDVKGMEISYDMLTFALKKAGQEGGLYFNALQNASNTTAGKLSNLSDQFDMFKNNLFLQLKPAVSSIIERVSSLMNKIQDWVKANKGLIYTIKIFVKDIYSELQPALQIVGYAFLKLLSLAKGIMYYWHKLGSFGKVIISSVATIAVGIWAWNKALIALKAAQVACNFVLAIGAALSGNWAALAAAGIIAAAGATMFLTSKQKEYNAEKSKEPESKKKSLYEINKEKVLKNAEKVRKNAEKFNLGKKPTDLTPTAPTTPTNKSEASKVSQPQATQIHINIGKLVETQNIKIENATKDFAEKLHNAVAEVLLNVVNDTNRIATQ
jgi:tape measure domain-containing protein